jgi:hypothetical protein
MPNAVVRDDALPSDLSLRRNRDFLTLLVSQSVSVVGDAVSSTAMPLLILALTGSGPVMGVVGPSIRPLTS